GYFQDASDCSRYCICAGGKQAALQRCPAGLIFNNDAKVCDGAYNTTCNGMTIGGPDGEDKVGGTQPFAADRTPSRLNRYSRYSSLSTALPTFVDWRASGVLSPIRDQGVCGVCWAFATTAAVEAAVSISMANSRLFAGRYRGGKSRFSVQQVADCTQTSAVAAASIGGFSYNNAAAAAAAGSAATADTTTGTGTDTTTGGDTTDSGAAASGADATSTDTTSAVNGADSTPPADPTVGTGSDPLENLLSICRPGWPGDALEYVAAVGRLQLDRQYPFLGENGTGQCSAAAPAAPSGVAGGAVAGVAPGGAAAGVAPGGAAAGVAPGGAAGGAPGVAPGGAVTAAGAWAAWQLPAVVRYEMVPASEEALLSAVAAQPVIVNIQSRVASFLSYAGGVYTDPLCDNGLLDHSVLVVGFGTDQASGTPFWIIRNSWGNAWGEQGYMRMARVGGRGTCGITSMPGFYPVTTSTSPCDNPNPCGAGECVEDVRRKSRGGYRCASCPDGYAVVENSDKSQTCVS
ncbi:unnamed protein product, partial [Closterium sp. NIES-64]